MLLRLNLAFSCLICTKMRTCCHWLDLGRQRSSKRWRKGRQANQLQRLIQERMAKKLIETVMWEMETYLAVQARTANMGIKTLIIYPNTWGSEDHSERWESGWWMTFWVHYTYLCMQVSNSIIIMTFLRLWPAACSRIFSCKLMLKLKRMEKRMHRIQLCKNLTYWQKH